MKICLDRTHFVTLLFTISHPPPPQKKKTSHLHVEVFKCHAVSPEQLHGVPGNEAEPKETLHLVTAGPLGHLGSQTGGKHEGERERWREREREKERKRPVLQTVFSRHYAVALWELSGPVLCVH